MGGAPWLLRFVWVFLADGCFAAKTPDYEVWISLDFLGFSRQNRDLSMGLRGNNAGRIFLSLFPVVWRAAGRGARGGTGESAGLSQSKLNLIPGFLEDIVVQAVSFGRVGAARLTASESRRCRAPGASWLRRPVAKRLPALDEAGDPARERDRRVPIRSLLEFMVDEVGR
jgi:hypothetical protein